MPDVLALVLSSPLQSWGVATRYNTRGTLSQPTKSGVIGLCAAALGRPRGADLSDLAALRFGVRVDRPGTLLVDYHTMSAASHGPLDPQRQRLPTADGKTPLKPGEGKVSRRHYLQDAVFVAAFEGEGPRQAALLAAVRDALKAPRYPLSLGRRSCPPDRPVLVGLFSGIALERSLQDMDDGIPWEGATAWQKWAAERDGVEPTPPGPLPVTVDDPEGDDLYPDLPAGGEAFNRVFGQRPVRHLVTTDAGPPRFDGDDAMDLLDGED
ncbi:type I-E CRISPR-associated protein Cas5/CasD [Nocardiopsis mangrovi]|uniref:Type I-E CRISPR-associated protein Cas5/CasD n=1 Tax=Nocardiopsis mangrovi TaxID=1179818 RepID=A0ABV9DUI2_9ACTN